MKSAIKLFLLTFLLLPSVALADNPYVVHHDGGGHIPTYLYYWHQVSSRYDRLVIDGDCKSACTMALGIISLDRICITPRGSFSFHAAHTTRGTEKNEKFTQIMRSTYAAPVREWVDQHHALDTTSFTSIRASQVTFVQHCSAPKHYTRDKELLDIVNSNRAKGRNIGGK